MTLTSLPAEPAFGDTLPAAHPGAGALPLLLQRRSASAADLGGPGPDARELELILRAATRVPDHGKLAPWRFILFEGAARTAFGARLAALFSADNPQAEDALLAFERARFERAPLVIAVVSRVTPGHKIPVWEQELSAGAVCFAMLLAANALGFAGQWLTEWYAYDTRVAAELGLGAGERVAGFVYIGRAARDPLERVRPDRAALVTRYGAEPAAPAGQPRPR